MLQINELVGFGAGDDDVKGPRSIAYSHYVTTGASLITHTYTAQSIGVAGVNRVVALVVSATNNVTSITVAGISATRANSSDLRYQTWYVHVPSGETADIVVTLSASSYVATAIFLANNLDSTTPIYNAVVYAATSSVASLTLTGTLAGDAVLGDIAGGESLAGTAGVVSQVTLSAVTTHKPGCALAAVDAGTVTTVTTGTAKYLSAVVWR